MHAEKIEETLSNLEIAHRQIERAIVLFLDDRDYVSALTLAGAAEEILGKLLNNEGKEHWLDSIAKAALRALGFRKKELKTPEALKTKKEIVNIANQHKNTFKHYNNDGTATLFVDVAAAEMIERAISNYFDLTQRETGAMGKFKELIIWGENT
jgi:vacuolar-type H+-ATPase subunit F/Vma7